MSPWVLVLFLYYAPTSGSAGGITQIEMPNKATCFKALASMADVIHHNNGMDGSFYCIRRDGKDYDAP